MANNLIKSILILDHDSTFSGLVADLFRGRGLKVTEARSVQEADTILARVDPILAICDYPLPDIEVGTWITKLRESGINFPIVLVSQDWCDAKTFNWLRNVLKVSLFLQKPIVPELFMHQIENLVPAQMLNQAVHDQASGLVERQNRFSLVKVAYGKGLALAWEALTLAVSTAQKDPQNNHAIAEAVHLAHKLAGTAGSVGFKRVGEVAVKIQNLLRPVDLPDTVQQIRWPEISHLLADGETYVRSATRASEAAAKGSEKLSASRILLFGEDDYYQKFVHNLKTTIPVEIELSSGLDATLQRTKSTSFDALIFDLSTDDQRKIFQLAREIRLLPGYESLPFGFICRDRSMPGQVDLVYVGGSVILSEKPGKTEIERACDKLLSFRKANKPCILTVDDDDIFTKFIVATLTAEGMVVFPLNEPIEIMEAVEQFKPDVVLLDVMMPGISGYDVCRMLRSNEKWQDLGIIFLTLKNDHEARAAAFLAGGDDFLSKPIMAEELIMRVKIQLDQVRRRRLVPTANQESGTISNHNFVEPAAKLLADAKAANLPMTLGLLSIDDFMNINYTHGWSAAREVFLSLGKLIHCRFRVEDVRGCLGEGTFALAFSGEQPQVIAKAIDKLLEEFSAIKFTGANGTRFSASFTAGLAKYPADGSDVQALLDAPTNIALATGNKNLVRLLLPVEIHG